MIYNNINNPKIKAILDSIKYHSYSLENNVKQAFEDAEDEADFILNTLYALKYLQDEITDLNNKICEAVGQDLPTIEPNVDQQNHYTCQYIKNCPFGVPGEHKNTKTAW